MKVTATCVQDRPEVWFKGTKDEKAVRIFTMLDSDVVDPMPNTFDYRPTADELAAHGQGSLIGRQLTIGVRDIKPAKGGRLVFSGKLQENGANPTKVAK